jgi:hypothetical protein
MQLENAAVSVEEDQVEPKAHPERVHASAARDQQARARALAGEQGQAKQAAEPRIGDRNRPPEQLDPLEGAEA